MKKIILSISALVALTLVSCGPSAKDALAYNDKVMTIVNNATLAQNSFLDQIDGHNIDSLKIAYKLYSDKSKECFGEITKVPAFADKKEFLDAATSFVKTLGDIADNQGKQMVEIMSKDSASVTEDDTRKVQELAAKFDEENDKVTKIILDAQQAFSKQWKFEIEAAPAEKH